MLKLTYVCDRCKKEKDTDTNFCIPDNWNSVNLFLNTVKIKNEYCEECTTDLEYLLDEFNNGKLNDRI